MPLLLGAATVACTIVGMLAGQVAVGMEALGVVVAGLVLMSVQRE